MSYYKEAKCFCCGSEFVEAQEIFVVQKSVVRFHHPDYHKSKVGGGRIRFERRASRELWCAKCVILGRKAAKGEYID